MNTIESRIIEKAKAQGELYGSMNAGVLVFDIAGFTSLTETLMKNEKNGAEELSSLLEYYFSPIIKTIDAFGGDIATFAGDSVTAIFPADICGVEELLRCAMTVKLRIDANLDESIPSEYRRQIRIALATGWVEWHVSSVPGIKGSMFSGTAFDKAYAILPFCRPGLIIAESEFTEPIIPTIPGASYEDILADDTFPCMLILPSPIMFNITEHSLISTKIEEDESIITTIEKINDKENENTAEIIHKEAEFRNVLSMFIKYWGQDIEQFGNTILTLAKKYEGNANYFDKTEKGIISLVIFGYPKMPRDPFENAIRFAFELRETLPHLVSIGFNYGLVYSGFIGAEGKGTYTCIGKSVNLSCRIMESLQVDMISGAETNTNRILSYAHIKNANSIFCKGYDDLQGVVELTSLVSLDEENYLNANNTELEHIEEKNIINNEPEALDVSLGNEGKKVFFGREKELKILENALSETNTFVSITGAPGTGKTKLALESLARCTSGKKILFIPDSIVKSPFSPFVNVIRTQLGFPTQGKITETEFNEKWDSFCVLHNAKKELDPYAFSLSSLIGVVQDIKPLHEIPHDNNLTMISWAITKIFVSLAAKEKIILFFEDVHDFDTESCCVFGLMVKVLTAHSVSILATSRNSLNEYMQGIKKAQSIFLTDFTESDSYEFASCIASETIPEELFYKVFELSGGNPFFLEQIVLFLIETGQVSGSRGIVKIPDTLFDVIIARIDSLGEEFKLLIQAASILGIEFSVDILDTLLKEIYTGEKGAKELIGMGCEERLFEISGEISYLFRHVLIRDTMYNMQLSKTVEKLHQVALSALEQSKPDALLYPKLLMHAEGSKNYIKQRFYLEKLLFKGHINYNLSHVVIWADKLLTLDIDDKTRYETLVKKADAHSALGNTSKALEVYDEAANVSLSMNDKALMITILVKKAQLYLSSGNIIAAKPLVMQALETEDVPYETQSLLYSTAVSMSYYENNIQAAHDYCVKQMEVAELSGSVYEEISANNNLAAILLAEQKDKDMPFVALRKSLDLIESSLDDRLLADTYYYFTVAYTRKCDFVNASIMCEKLISCARKSGDVIAYMMALVKRGSSLTMEERYNDALVALKQADVLALDYKNDINHFTVLSNVGYILFFCGKYKESLPFFYAYYSYCKKNENGIGLSIAGSQIGRSLHAMGESKKALGFFMQELTHCKESNDNLGKGLAFGYVGMILLEQMSLDKAQECIDYSIDIIKDYAVPCRLTRLYLEKARIMYIKILQGNLVLDQTIALILDLCQMAKDTASEVTEPIVIDIQFKADILIARTNDLEDPGYFEKYLHEIHVDSLRRIDKALYYYECGRFNNQAENWNKSKMLDYGLFMRLYELDNTIGLLS